MDVYEINLPSGAILSQTLNLPGEDGFCPEKLNNRQLGKLGKKMVLLN